MHTGAAYHKDVPDTGAWPSKAPLRDTPLRHQLGAWTCLGRAQPGHQRRVANKEPRSPLLHSPSLQVTLLEKLGQQSLVPHIPPLLVPDLGGWGWGMGHVGAGPMLPSTAAVNLRSETHGTGTSVVHSCLGRARKGGCSCDDRNRCHCPCRSQWPPRVAEH